jgi:hypothetical protein
MVFPGELAFPGRFIARSELTAQLKARWSTFLGEYKLRPAQVGIAGFVFGGSVKDGKVCFCILLFTFASFFALLCLFS